MTVTAAGRRAAWDACLAVTASLMPALNETRYEHPGTVNARLGAVVIRLRRYEPLWGPTGPMLVTAGHAAVRLLRAGDRDGLTELARLIAFRLFLLSCSPGSGRRPTNHRPHDQHPRPPEHP